MRVLTVGNMYPPHHFGGYEQVWQSAVAHLREQGHDVRVLATDFRRAGQVAQSDEPAVFRSLRWYRSRSGDEEFPRVPLVNRIAIERHNRRVLRRQLRGFRPEVVAFWSMGGMSHSLIEQVRRADIPMVAFVHDEWLDYGRYTDQWLRPFYVRPPALARAAESIVGVPTTVDYARAGRYVFVSDFIRQRALDLPLHLSDTAVAHSGIDPIFMAPAPEREWDWKLVHVGRLHPDKGIHDALGALTHLPPHATLTFAGSWDTHDEEGLAREVERLGLTERVHMRGHLSHRDVAALVAEHDVLVFPVRWDEPWGLVPLEAMSNRPVIATGRGGSAEYLRHEENALLVPSRDAPALAAAVCRLAESPALRRRLVAGGRETAPRHTEAGFNQRVERHLNDVVAERHAVNG